jgi:hypothetical protein
MRLFWNAIWFVVVLLAATLAKLLFDNILYAAIMARLKSSFGIEEGDLIAVVATNLIPIAATLIVVAFIYWLSSQHHAAKAATAAPETATQAATKLNILGRIFFRRDPLPAIAISLAIALIIGIYWQINYGPLTQLRKSPPVSALSDTERNTRFNVLANILNFAVNRMKSGCASGREIAENWQYKVQSGGADQLINDLTAFSNSIYFASETSMAFYFKAYLGPVFS